jgi:NADH dehydrogenase
MDKNEIHAVTGAFGYSGRYIATRLLEQGRTVVTLTNSVDRANPFGGRVHAVPLSFGEPDKLAAALAGVDVLYNTYWVRFNHGTFTHGEAVENTLVLFEAARRAGVRRVVHVSITNPSEDSPLEYFAGKARLERALRESGLSYAILRPTVLFGREDILVNNIAWALRRFPFFAVFGDGSYRLQPVHVDVLAELAVTYGMRSENVIVNAVGPETFTYRELVKAVGEAIGRPRTLVNVSPGVGCLLGKLVGWFKHDVFITREEIRGLMSELLRVNTPPAGKTLLTAWMKENAATLGLRYASELDRRRDRQRPYFVNNAL